MSRTAISAIFPDFVLGISSTFKITAGTCRGVAFALISSFIFEKENAFHFAGSPNIFQVSAYRFDFPGGFLERFWLSWY